MALLKKDPTNGWVFVGREGSKHRGKTMEKVAEEDPSYLTFLWSNSLRFLSDEAIDALDDLMDKNEIPRELKKGKNVRRTRRSHEDV